MGERDTKEMITVEMKFTCDECKRSQLTEVRVTQHLIIGSDTLPDGWIVRPENMVLKAYCPEHAKNH